MSARNWNSAKLTPAQKQRQAQLLTGYGAIQLLRDGDYVIVKVETVPGEWIEVIRESLDGNFSHVVEPLGIEQAMLSSGYDPSVGEKR